MKKIFQRTRFFIPGEGESEWVFVRWVQEIANANNLHIHLVPFDPDLKKLLTIIGLV
jgi:hypothetical protein